MSAYKTHTGPFGYIWAGQKTAEFRREDRQTFRVGDALWLEEWDPATEQLTGREIRVRVTHVQRSYGIPDGFAMVSFAVEELCGE